MQDVNYWKQFENTGRIEDYLSYCRNSTPALKEQQKRKEQTGVNSHAGIHQCNRNNIEADAYRGI